MTTADSERRRRSKWQYWPVVAIFFVVVGGTAFGIQLAEGDSVRESLSYAIFLAVAIGAYYVGYHQGRHENDPGERGYAPPPKQR